MKNILPIRLLNSNEEIPYNLLLLADETVDAIEKYIFDCEIYVLEKEDRIIATYALKIMDNDCAEIKNIAVDANFQSQGIGTYLIQHAETNLIKRGFKSLLIATGDTPSKQLNLYQKLGFKKIKIIENFFVDNYPEPIFENGKQLKNMVVLQKILA